MQAADRIYEYRTVQTQPNSWADAGAAIKRGGPALEQLGGHLYGVWASQIGPSVNELTVLTDWADVRSAARHGEAVAAGPDIVSSKGQLLRPTARPLDNTPPEGSGIFTQRWFTVHEDHWEEFLQLSVDAWKGAEPNVGNRIYGFWRTLESEQQHFRVLLCTQYRDLATWDSSRWWKQDSTSGNPPAANQYDENYRKRRIITVDTSVSVLRLL